ncbi:hypothetical protein ScPMuIL_003311 [Solemya velum]
MAVFEVQNLYGTPLSSRKRPSAPLRRMTLIDLRNVNLEEENEPYRKGSCGTVRSEGTGAQYYAKHGNMPMYDSNDSLDSKRSSAAAAMRIRRISSICEGSTRFPKLEECAHFHYDVVELGPLNVELCDEERENYRHNVVDSPERGFLVRVTSSDKSWILHRTYRNFRMLDRQLHKCIVDRKISCLPELAKEEDDRPNNEIEDILSQYLEQFSDLARRSGTMMNCGSITNWLEIDNRGNQILALDDTGINTPAIAAAHTIKRYSAQATDEISLEVGDIVSVIDMPPAEDSVWWRGKRGFEVGFFPRDCVEVIGDKVPQSVAQRIPYIAVNSKKPIVRKHGKFLSFLRMFFSTRPARIQLKQSGIVKERVFGCDLGEHLLNSEHEVPLVLKCCSDVIEESGIVDGIYRLSGINSNIQKLRLAFDEDRMPDLTAENYIQDIHSISSLLKMYFRELPNPLLTYHLYEKFADAVRDEDNKLLKIHDVVQQLPPPHYRTTEYLMRHLARVAGHGNDTGMHSKNLAIVWAPNLLRSKELESGGGAAALQGVGIQAVVTEFLICYADLIFSDKMPSYNSPEMRKSHKKPRPKSLAISTPTRLLSLEEARDRALSANLKVPSQKYIDVGGGPDSLPAKYHTVIDLPGYKKRVQKDLGPIKNKKSPVSGWKSLFSRSRSGSVKQKGGRKSSMQADALNFGERKAITEEDVQHWKKRRLRGAKSVESLVSMPSSLRSSGTYGSKNLEGSMVVNLYTGDDQPTPTRHKRSLSSDAPRDRLHSIDSSLMYQNFIDEGTREMPIDVDVSVTPDFYLPNDDGSPEKKAERAQSFMRGDSKRRVIHRRIASQPSTPKQEREKCAKFDEENKENVSQGRTVTQGVNNVSERHSAHEIKDTSEKFVVHLNNADVVRSIEHSQSSHSLGAESGDKRKSSRQSPKDTRSGRSSPKDSRTSPKQKKKKRDSKDQKTESQNDKKKKKEEIQTLDLPESPGARRKQRGDNTQTPSPKKNYYSKHHDYAEILSDEERGNRRSSELRYGSSEERLQDNVEQHLSDKECGSTDSVIYAKIKKTKKESGKEQSDVNVENCDNLAFESEGKYIAPRQDLLNEISNLERSIQTMQHYPNHPQMSKCLSIPSDIQRSLENVNMSQMDLMSSITISELSQSVDSFNVNFNDELELTPTAIRGRSVSIDGSGELDSPFGRTLKEINDQIDRAFKENRGRVQSVKTNKNKVNIAIDDTENDEDSSLRETHFYDNGEFVARNGVEGTSADDSSNNLTVEQEEELCVSLYDNYPTPEESDTIVDGSGVEDTTPSGMGTSYENIFVDQKSEIQVMDAPEVIRVPSQTNSNTVLDTNSSTNTDVVKSSIALVERSGEVGTRSDIVCTRPPLKQTMSLDLAPNAGRTNEPPRPAMRHGLSLDLEVISQRSTETSSFMDTDARLKHLKWNHSPLLSPKEQKVTSPSANRSSKRDSKILSPLTPTEPGITEVVGPDSRKGRGSPKSKPNKPKINIVTGQLPSPLGSPLRTSAVTEIEDIMAADAEDIEILQRQGSVDTQSPKSSPKSPRQQQQPRWEDLAGLNTNFHEISTFDEKLKDLADFNDTWRQQLTPTGDSIRQTHFSEGFTFAPSSPMSETNGDHVIRDMSADPSHHLVIQMPARDERRDRTPEIGTEDKILVMEKPTIKKSTTDSSLHDRASQVHPDMRVSAICDRSTFAQERSRSLDSEGLASALASESSAANRREQFVLTHSLSSESYKQKQESPKSRKIYPTGQLSQNVSESMQNIDRTIVQQSPVGPGGYVITRQSSQSESTASVTVDSTGRTSQSVSQSAAVSTVSAEAIGPVNQSESLATVSAVSVNTSKQSAGASVSGVSVRRSNQSSVASLNQEETTENWFAGNEGSQVTVPFDRTALDTILNNDRPMLEEIDINESCFGLPSHQNLSNELKEKIEESMRDITSPVVPDIMSSQFPKNFGSGFVQDVEVTFGSQVPPPGHAPVESVQVFPDDPVVGEILSPEIDTSEEIFQNAINTGREMMNIARQQDGSSDPVEVCDDDCRSQAIGKGESVGPNTAISPSSGDALSPAQVLSQTDHFSIHSSSPTSKSFPFSKEAQLPQDLSNLPQLAPPELELLEVKRPCILKSKSSKSQLDCKKTSPSKLQPQSGTCASQPKVSAQDYMGSERGEARLVIESRPSLKKTVQTIRTEGVPQTSRQVTRLNSHDDDVFVDGNDLYDVDSMAADFGAEKEANYVDRHMFKGRAASDHGSMFVGSKKHQHPLDKSVDSKLLNNLQTRCSLDESVLQMASARHDDFDAFNSFQDRNEDIRLTKAHKSIKLQSLCELFEDATGQKLPALVDEKSKCPTLLAQEQTMPQQEQSSERTVTNLNEIPNVIQSVSPTFNVKRRSWSRERTKSESEQEMNRQAPSPTPRTHLPTYEKWQSVEPLHHSPGSAEQGVEYMVRKPVTASDIIGEKQSPGSARPPICRPSSRTRTPSDSSLTESDGARSHSSGSPKYIRPDGSPQSNRSDNSPKTRKQNSLQFARIETVGKIGIQEEIPKCQKIDKFVHNQTVSNSEKTQRHSEIGSPTAVRQENFIQDNRTASVASDTDEPSRETNLQRRGSVKELAEMFECKQPNSSPEPVIKSETQTDQNRSRVRSVSPSSARHADSHPRELGLVTNVRHSLEIPIGSLSHTDGILRPHSLRLGPKPFYGVKK